MNLLQVPAAIVIVILVIVRQLRGEPLRGKRLILLPAVITVVGFIGLGEHGHHPATADYACIVIDAVIAAGIGAAQGALLRLEPHEGVLWTRMPVRGLWLWPALVVSRVGMTVVAVTLDAHVAGSTAPVLFLLGVNRLGQGAVVTPRALASGVPFAPEKDGRPFDVRDALAGVVGGAAADRRPAQYATRHPAQHPAPTAPRNASEHGSGYGRGGRGSC
ncbi:hypothetical protein I3F60_22255 [Streptomyces sp. MUM 136J]|uniref:hypothetical protein n=1 Tax=Streptomyces sp. MUM 136J TaxID=2791992 RepID=UPI001F032E8D|nr:hypothetical protein [Streptomyces sp. MUM 136J]MCH0571941.1 hypothetical protein [Streptomyces sp. MUM 136J]